MKKSKQLIPRDIHEIITNDVEIIGIYEHFSNRCIDRFLPENAQLPLHTYWLEWILVTKGTFLKWENDRMIRIIGNYHKDKILYKIIYIYNNALKTYIPLTIFSISEHKKKFRIQQKLLKNKKYGKNKTT